ncbi:hypothetical protein N0B28_13395 [Pseudomonas sp. SD17-1]|uniref:hypothetical protein n=1 Tax=Pseudomonas TaxID=286 RepID=UPI0023DAB2E6|nr:hypothetical protein [Pseudomonas sp. SD17-1]WEJ19299.1 hypothetical protein N0B28_13395 [Pseudomonas sp. SD17-1]
MRGSIQSANYTPKSLCGKHGSGWKLDLASGDFEINGPDVQLGSLPPEPQMATVTVGEWAESDLPSNAVERYKFIGDQVMKIPAEHRDSAEFSTEDISFDRDGSDIRTTLTYERPENTDEASARSQARMGTSIKLENGKLTISDGGVPRIVLRRLDQPFVVDGGQAYISEACIDEGSIGIGEHRAESKIDLASALADWPSVATLKITDPADQIRQVIRDELKPGGMLHRN